MNIRPRLLEGCASIFIADSFAKLDLSAEFLSMRQCQVWENVKNETMFNISQKLTGREGGSCGYKAK